jgi:hypothetical protein
MPQEDVALRGEVEVILGDQEGTALEVVPREEPVLPVGPAVTTEATFTVPLGAGVTDQRLLSPCWALSRG